MRVAQINVTATLSTGRIAVGIGQALKREGHKTLLAFSRGYAPSDIPWVRVGNAADVALHGAYARLTDRAGFFGKHATRKLVKQLRRYCPDVIHLHNLHGYYLHLPTLFAYLAKVNVPVVWTLHDCWAYTGHCPYYTMAEGTASRNEGKTHRAGTTYGCDRWLQGCGKCPRLHAYPASLFADQSARNWKEKRRLFTSIPDLVLVTPSQWLLGEVRRSFLGQYPSLCIPNGIDVNAFRPCESEEELAAVMRRYGLDEVDGRKLVLGVAGKWEERKGLSDFVQLAEELGDDYCVTLVGMTEGEIRRLPARMLGLPRVHSVRELSALYTAADIHVSLSREESMGMTLIEAMACGTQVLCYGATALPENVTPEVGAVVAMGDVAGAAREVRRLCEEPKSAAACRRWAERYDQNERFCQYVRLYEDLLGYGAEPER